ncbi:MAG: hypothetical protein Q9161_008248 [Pseudevernia consocians]
MFDVVSSGAVFIPAIISTRLTFSQITPAIANDIANVLNQFTSQGVEVWLRFAYEVNYYITQGSGPNGGPEYPEGTIASNLKVLMFWSPNADSVSNIQGWWPGANYVDIVGLDVYLQPGATFASTYGPFYNAFAKTYNKHLCIGETASGNDAVADKEAWVKQLADTDAKNGVQEPI